MLPLFVQQHFLGVTPVQDWGMQNDEPWLAKNESPECTMHGTLDLLKSIVLDGEIPSLFSVGAYREDEVPDHHPLAFHIRELEQMNVSTTQMKIGNLSVNYAISFVAEALAMDDDDDDSKVKSLAETIHRKTEGNPFFMLIGLGTMMQSTQRLTPSICTCQQDESLAGGNAENAHGSLLPWCYFPVVSCNGGNEKYLAGRDEGLDEISFEYCCNNGKLLRLCSPGRPS
eukprot:scaffold5549_cov79-Skeletonema_dohrnii-CCMP3373.AAC.12